MAVSTTTIVVVMIVSAAFATAFAFIMMVSATATSTSEMLYEVLHFLVGSFAVYVNLASEVECLACERVVGVDGDTIFLNLLDLSHKTVLLIVHQSDYCTFVDIVVVEMAVDGECLSAKLMNTFRIVFTKGLRWLEYEIEVASRLEGYDILLKCIERNAESGYKLKGMLLGCLFLELFFAVYYRIKLVVG